jgi:hypothetical protein
MHGLDVAQEGGWRWRWRLRWGHGQAWRSSCRGEVENEVVVEARWRLRRSQGLRWRSRWRGRYIIGARLPPQPTTPTQHGALHHLAHTACHHLPVSGPPQGGPRYLPLGLGLGLGLGLSSCHPSVAAVRVRVRVRVRGGGMGGTCDAKAHAAMLHGAKK